MPHSSLSALLTLLSFRLRYYFIRVVIAAADIERDDTLDIYFSAYTARYYFSLHLGHEMHVLSGYSAVYVTAPITPLRPYVCNYTGYRFHADFMPLCLSASHQPRLLLPLFGISQ